MTGLGVRPLAFVGIVGQSTAVHLWRATPVVAMRTGTRPKLQACVIKLGLCVSEHGRPAPVAAAFDVSEYVEGRYPFGASPATVHTARSGVANVDQVPRLSDSTRGTALALTDRNHLGANGAMMVAARSPASGERTPKLPPGSRPTSTVTGG